MNAQTEGTAKSGLSGTESVDVRPRHESGWVTYSVRRHQVDWVEPMRSASLGLPPGELMWMRMLAPASKGTATDSPAGIVPIAEMTPMAPAFVVGVRRG